MSDQLCFWPEPEDDFPCNDCAFDVHGVCSHIEDEGTHCILGDFRIRRDDLKCSCGKTMQLLDPQPFGSDGAKCSCGRMTIFNNQGHRLGWLEAWRKGLVIGT